MNNSLKLVMAVFNPIQFDGRVKRAAETLSTDFDITLLSPPTSREESTGLPEKINLQRGWLLWKRWPTGVTLAAFWFQLLYIILSKRPKVIYVHDFYLPFPGLLAAKLVRAKCIYDAHELIIPCAGVPMSLRDTVYYRLERISASNFDLVIAANPERAVLMQEHYNLKTEPLSVLNISKPTTGSVSKGDLLERFPALRKRVGERIVVYMGDIALARGLGTLIAAFDRLSENIRLVVVGDGPDRISLQQKYLEKDIYRIQFLGAVPQLWIQDILSLCDLGVLIYSMQGLNNYYCSPNKIFEYTQADIPVVATAQPPLVSMIKAFEIGAIAGREGVAAEADDFVSAIIEVLDRYEFYQLHISAFVDEHKMTTEQQKLRSAATGLCK